MKIRKAKFNDLKEIDKIYVEGSIDEGRLQFPNVSKKEMIKDLEKHKSERTKNWKKEMEDKNNFWIVAEDKRNIMGFGQAWIKHKDTGITESVYVGGKYRKSGVGEKIMKELIKWLKGKKAKYIESSYYNKNKPSAKLHEKLGFKPISIKVRLK